MKVHLPWAGKATGSSAGLIYQSYWGKTYARTFPAIFHYPDTPAQQACQAPFYEIQKAWAEPYSYIKNAAGKTQRVNHNIYNEFFKSAMQVYNPYNEPKFRKPLKNFGLDPNNRMRASMHVTLKIIVSSFIFIQWQDWKVTNNLSYTPTNRIFLLINKTQRNLHATQTLILPNITGLNIQNTQEWQQNDDILLYVAVYGEGWLGNFNLIPMP